MYTTVQYCFTSVHNYSIAIYLLTPLYVAIYMAVGIMWLPLCFNFNLKKRKSHNLNWNSSGLQLRNLPLIELPL